MGFRGLRVLELSFFCFESWFGSFGVQSFWFGLAVSGLRGLLSSWPLLGFRAFFKQDRLVLALIDAL